MQAIVAWKKVYFNLVARASSRRGDDSVYNCMNCMHGDRKDVQVGNPDETISRVARCRRPIFLSITKTASRVKRSGFSAA